MREWRAWVLVALTVTSYGCSSGVRSAVRPPDISSSIPPPPPVPSPEPKTMGETSPLLPNDSSVPAMCSRKAVVGTITGFVEAYNRGQSDVVEQFFAPAPRFQWYSDPNRRFPENPDTRRRETLSGYLASRRTAGETLSLVRVDYSESNVVVNGASGFLIANVGLNVMPVGSSPDTSRQNGKGAIDCDSGKIAVWYISSW
jgi:hypothetical protein